MKISYAWLSKYLSQIPSPDETARLLTNTGLEVESFEPFESIKGSLKGLVCGKVLSCIKHPQADRLSLTKVDCGEENLRQIVCGAPNVREGQYVVVALPGTTVYPSHAEPFTIKESKIRGELSQGMICAEDEIGLGESHEGILVLNEAVQPGTAASSLFKVYQDTVFEIGLTPNHVDAASHLGVARDLRAALYQNPDIQLKRPAIQTNFQSEGQSPVSIQVECKEALSRYSGVCMENVRVGESPEWLQQALRAIGLKPINNVVDISNFVLHETGQPLHAFDLDKISSGRVVLKTFPRGQHFVTLDGVQRMLQESDLMVCNGEEDPMCIAGVFGGLHSGVNPETQRIFIESARFHPTWIRKTARHHNLNTDAAFRFERGSDPEITLYALQRAVDLIAEICGAKVLGPILDWYPDPSIWVELDYPWWKLDRLAGFTIPREDAKKILERLEIQILSENEAGLHLRIPPFKVDVSVEQDITEEILRIYGYNHIPIPPKISSSFPEIQKPDTWKLKNHLSDHLAALGFAEVLNNSLTSGELASLLSDEKNKAVILLNPLSNELNAMRTSALFGLCESISWNRNRQQNELSLFEWGNTYGMDSSGQYTETGFLALAQCGFAGPENWNQPRQKVGYSSIKGVTERLLKMIGVPSELLEFEPKTHPLLDECIEIKLSGASLGCLGRIGSRLASGYDLNEDVWCAELNWQGMLDCFRNEQIQFREIPRFPQVRRDLSLLIGSDVSFAGLRKAARAAEKKLLTDVQLFDVYTGKNLPEGKKSYAISLSFFDPEKTLTDEQVNRSMSKIMHELQKQFQAELRG